MNDLQYGPQEGIRKEIPKQIKPFTDFIPYWSTSQSYGLKEALNRFVTEQIPTGKFISHFGRIQAVRGRQMVELTESEYFPFIVLKVMDLNHLHFYFTGDRFNTFVDIYDEVTERTRVIRNFEASRISYPPGFLEERNRFLPALIKSTSPDFEEIEKAYKLNKDRLDMYKMSFNKFRDAIFEYNIFAPEPNQKSKNDNIDLSREQTSPWQRRKQNLAKTDTPTRTAIGWMAIISSVIIGFYQSSILWGIGWFVAANIIIAPIIKFLENRKKI